jgi:hypothetical protein
MLALRLDELPCAVPHKRPPLPYPTLPYPTLPYTFNTWPIRSRSTSSLLTRPGSGARPPRLRLADANGFLVLLVLQFMYIKLIIK